MFELRSRGAWVSTKTLADTSLGFGEKDKGAIIIII